MGGQRRPARSKALFAPRASARLALFDLNSSGARDLEWALLLPNHMCFAAAIADVSRACCAPSMPPLRDLKKAFLLMPALEYIAQHWPYWNQTGGARHIIPMEGGEWAGLEGAKSKWHYQTHSA